VFCFCERPQGPYLLDEPRIFERDQAYTGRNVYIIYETSGFHGREDSYLGLLVMTPHIAVDGSPHVKPDHQFWKIISRQYSSMTKAMKFVQPDNAYFESYHIL
jgi:hypothetical protein